MDDGRRTGLPPADMSSAENWPGTGRCPCGGSMWFETGTSDTQERLVVSWELGGHLGQVVGSSEAQPVCVYVGGDGPLPCPSEGGRKGGKPKSSALDRLGSESHFPPGQ